MTNEDGRTFREAWIAGVLKHFAGEPKPGYIAPWDDTPEWQQETDADIFGTIEQQAA
ncbi:MULTISPECIES: hypothetical protein [unclassified Kitasatospora]|uniref:hypothetical protein n=1 Tax=unclassified Kitasatospora TaxID=2633591 RepID=UPI0012FCBE3E|nr:MULTISPECIES: hypothetical protein [unclassified Kitasatospora]